MANKIKISFKIVNRIPRILFKYKSFTTNKQLTYRYLPIPARPKTIINFLKSIIFANKIIHTEELGILLSHDDIYKPDDIILAVGVGSGISLIHNATKNRIVGSYIGIEASREQIERAFENANLNGIDSTMYELIEGFVGNPDNVYGKLTQHSSRFIDINQMNFSVLELDCEGSEVEIIRDLTVKPRNIIVELHPMYRSIDIDEFLDSMRIKGYKLYKAYTVNGDQVMFKNIKNHFKIPFINLMKDFKMDWGDGLIVFNFKLIS